MRIDTAKMWKIIGKRLKACQALPSYSDTKSGIYANVAILLALATSFLPLAPQAFAMNGLGHPVITPKWAIDDTRGFTLGAGFRGSGVWMENPSADNFKTLFSIDNARVFLNGQIHKYIKFEGYTDCTFCNNTDPGGSR